jgi:hypothetical protein
MPSVIDTAEAVRVSAAVAVVLACVGLCLAWLPALRHEGLVCLAARLLATVGLFAAIVDFGGLGGVLGPALAAMGFAAMWQSQPAPEVPRPRRKGIFIASAATGLAVFAALRGWSVLSMVPTEARVISALVASTVGALATVAVADRARVRMREAVRDRLYS